jgi:hypothetical protein
MTRGSTATFIALEILCLAATQGWGGWPWTAIGATAIGMLAVVDLRPASLAMVVPSLVWLALFRATGNRELFFPFTIHLASLVALCLGRENLWRGMAGGGLIGSMFLVIRALQQASVKVLGVESVVTALILGLVVATLPAIRGRDAVGGGLVGGGVVGGGVVVLASLLAYASLAL